MTRCTASGKPAEGPEDAPTPTEKTILDGQKADHWVLCETERAKGFVRPVRTGYVHVGPPGPRFPLRDLTDEERQRTEGSGWVKFEPYPPGFKGSALGKYWSQVDIDKVDKGCGVLTTMGRSIAETYARQPGYYGSTWCCGCRAYIDVGERGEFVWDGTKERVGT